MGRLGKHLAKHKMSKQQRHLQEQKMMQMSDIIDMKKKSEQMAIDRANKYVMETVMPVFVLYLIEHFHCKSKGVVKFMTWFDEMQKWLEEYPEGFEEIKKDLWEQADVRIDY